MSCASLRTPTPGRRAHPTGPSAVRGTHPPRGAATAPKSGWTGRARRRPAGVQRWDAAGRGEAPGARAGCSPQVPGWTRGSHQVPVPSRGADQSRSRAGGAGWERARPWGFRDPDARLDDSSLDPGARFSHTPRHTHPGAPSRRRRLTSAGRTPRDWLWLTVPGSAHCPAAWRRPDALG